MRVRQGWSGEIAPNTWAKADVELDEDDLIRLWAQHDIPHDRPGTLTNFQVYQLLEVEAEILLTSKLTARFGYTPGRERLSGLHAQKNQLIEKLKTRTA